MDEKQMQQLQAIEQNLQSLEMQKQTCRGQLLEAESALGELEGNKDSFRIIGNVMVRVDAATLSAELKDKVAIFSSRMQTLEKQSGQLQKEAKNIQETVMKSLGEKK